MERNRKLWAISLLVLGALVVGLQAQPANAQEFQGKFTLPSEVRWGLATLPAGDYSFKLDKTDAGASLVTVYRGLRGVAMIAPQCLSDPKSERSAIVVEAGIVRELSLPQIGMDLSFRAHKPAHPAIREEEQLAQIIPVAAAGAGR